MRQLTAPRQLIVTGLLLLASAGIHRPAIAAVTPSGDPVALASAIVADGSWLAGAAFEAVPPSGTPHAVADSPLAGFPTRPATYAILTTGDATLADDPNTSEGSGQALGGNPVRGTTDLDVTVLRIDLNVPSGRNCLLFDFRFLSEEFPEWVGYGFNDAFIAELNASTWTTSNTAISAPRNFAFDPAQRVISINSTGVAHMSASEAAGTTYDGATRVLAATAAVGSANANGTLPGNNSVYLSIFDQGDQILDSAVFVDNLRLITVVDPATACIPGARAATVLTTTTVIASYPKLQQYFPTLNARLTDAVGIGLAGKLVNFAVTNPVTGQRGWLCARETDSSGFASCSDPSPWLTAVTNLGYEAYFIGDSDNVPASSVAPLVTVSGTGVR